MKTKATFIYIIAVVVFCVFLLISATGAFDISVFYHQLNVLFKIILIVFIAVGIWLLFFKQKQQAFKTIRIGNSETGEVLISVKVVEDHALKYIQKYFDVASVHVNVVPYDNIVEINLKVSLRPTADVAAVTQRLKDEVTTYVSEKTGIVVGKTNVIVQNASEPKTV